MVAPWTLAFAVAGEPPLVRRRFFALFALQAVCLALTLARGAWLGLTAGCVGFLVMLAYGWREPRLAWSAGAALVAGCAVLAAMTFLPLPASQEQTQAAGLSYPQLRVESTMRRSVIWQHAVGLAPPRWLVGYGPATFERVFSERFPPGTIYQGADAVVDDPHSWPIERLLTTGLVGLGIFVGMLITFYITIMRVCRRRPGRWPEALTVAAAASVMAYLVQALVTPDVVVLTVLFWVALAIVVRLSAPSINPT
jgi:O-antigen ligase